LLIFSQLSCVVLAQDSEPAGETKPKYVSANSQKLCKQIAGMTIEQAIDFINKSQMIFSLKKCTVSSGSTYQQGNIQFQFLPQWATITLLHPVVGFMVDNRCNFNHVLVLS
jgi:hypothetical protein